MKTFLSLVVFIFVLFFSCTKEARLITSFDFTVAVEHDSMATVSVNQPTKLVITPDRVAVTQKFSFKYSVNEGSDAVLYKDSISTLPVDKWINLDTLTIDLGCRSDSIGSHLITAIIKDEDGREQAFDIPYFVSYSDLQVSVKTPDNKIDYKKPVAVDLSIASDSPDKTLSYKIKYSFINNIGALYAPLENGDPDMSKPIALDKLLEIEKGTYNFIAVIEGTGEAILKFEIQDNKGHKVEKMLDFLIAKEEFELTASITPPIITVGEESTININIEAPVHSERVEYTLKYEFEQGTGTVTDLEGNILNANEFYPIQVGITRWTVTSLETGAPNINFVSENSTNFKDNASDSFEVQAYLEPFTLAVAQENDLKLSGEAFNISVSAFATSNHDTNVNYFVSYQFYGTNRGSITRNGVSYAEGEQIPIPYGASNLSFTPTGDADFLIVWKGRNSTDEEEEQNIQVEMYMRPNISGVLTWFFGDNERSCGNGCNWDYHYLVKMNVTIDPSATADIFRIRLRNDRPGHDTFGEYQTYTGSFNGGIKRDGFHEFFSPTFVPTGSGEFYNLQLYTLTVVDSNGVENSIEGVFTNDKNDAQ